LAKGSDVLAVLEAAQEALEADQSGISSRIQSLVDRLGPHTPLDQNISNAVKVLEEASINCEEARISVQNALSRIDLSPERLADLDQSLSRLHDLARKHRVRPGELGTVLDNLKTRIEQALGHQDRKKELKQKQAVLLQNYRAAAKELHSARSQRSKALSKAVSDLMQVLGMEGGVFEFQVSYEPQASPGRRGDDVLNLLVSANPGIPPAPMKKVASGGELSRISLAVKVASSAGASAPTQVFDEVDAGIGGETANSVGRLLQSVAAQGQALCVTHLAQVAVCADHQFRVVKNASGQATQVETSLLGERDRVDEIARMLGGRLSEQSRAHASELLASALTRH
jgi:DNA repair protein RecN (Recombination protein N)